MSERSGLDAQVVIGEETTYGVVAPTLDRAIEFTEESLKRNAERIESKAKRPGAKLLAKNRWQEGRVGAEGDLSFECMTKGHAFLWKHLLGNLTSDPVVGSTAAHDHVATLGSLFGKSLTVQAGRPSTAGVVEPFTYLGGKALSWELSNEVDGIVSLSVSFDFMDEVTTEALAAATFDPATDALDVPLTWVGGVLTLGGAEFDATSISLSGTNGFKTDRFFIRSNGRTKREPIQNERPAVEGELGAEFGGLTAYNRFVNGEVASLVGLWRGPEIEPGFSFELEATMGAVRFDGETPNVNGDEVIEQTLPFTVLDDGTAGNGFSVRVRNDSATP